MSAPYFFTAEIDTYAPPAPTSAIGGAAYGALPHGVAPEPTQAEASTEVLRASDVGYRTLETDAGGLQVYPPLLASAFAIDRRMNLDPTAAAGTVAWGALQVSNTGNRFDSIAGTRNTDGRGVRIYAGRKTYDSGRGLWLDPAFATISPLFIGLAQPWTLTESTLDVPIRGAEYWLDRPVQSTLYDGAGSYGGGADLTGVPRPKTRGTALNVPPVLVDATNRIYQYSDGPGTITALYEGGDTNLVFQANTSNLYSGSTTTGQYRTDNSRGLFQLGTTPVRSITADVTGQFPTAGSITTLVAIARYLLAEDSLLPAGNLYTAGFTALDAALPYGAGVFIGPGPVTGLDVVAGLLASAGVKLVPRRDGTLTVLALRNVSGSTPVATFTPANTVSVASIALPANVSPPAFRFRVGYQRNYNPGATDISPAVTSMPRKSFLANEYRYAGWSSTTVLTAYRRPSDPAPLGGALTTLANAQAVADALGALWGVRRRLYAVTVPIEFALARDIGDVVRLAWPLDDMANGKVGQVVGEQIRSGDATSTLMVLV